MNKIIWLIEFFLLISILGCSDFTSGVRYKNRSYVITGLLQAGAPIDSLHAIFVGQTISPYGEDPANIFILDANVWIEDLATEESRFLMLSQVGYIDPDSNDFIYPNHTYKLTAVIGTDTVWAETTIPGTLTLEPDPGYTSNPSQTYPQIDYDSIDTEHPLISRIENYVQGTDVYLYYEFYCLEEYYDAAYIHDFMGNEYPEDEDDYENSMTGSPRRTWTFFAYQPQFIEGNYFVTEAAYQLYFSFYGRHRVSVFKIDENYYRFNYSQEGYKFGGINNGYGYFGSVNGESVYTEIVE